ncbi:DMT family transporter [Abyssalbus ytuae]|uniref:DMT family transporter n=1 Tax=Abyssalbus ytuae TaxID=2926907 RepID=A0A9E6ZV78_9FLAO|nr:DMT family transporter [Abyssalbus ytuae]UOB17401.1 DMT family transporter [Abyssalbus ytuae]
MSKSTSKLFIILTGVLGIVLFSAKAVMVKLAYNYNVSTVNLLLFRMIFSLPFYVLMAILYKPDRTVYIEKKNYLSLFFFGFIGYYLASFFDFLGLQYIKASLERIILFIYPTIVIVLSCLFLKKRIKKIQIVAIILTYVGVVLASWGDFSVQGNEFATGALLIFLSALTYASYLVGSDWLIPKFGVITFTSYAMIVSCCCVIIHYLIFERTQLLNYHQNVYFLGLGMAFLSTVIPSYLVSYAIKKIGAADFSILGSLGPISTIILANIFLGEEISLLQFLGTLVVILGIVIISKSKK